MLGNEALDYFRFAIGPQNIDPPARAGIFPSYESWWLLEHPMKYEPMAGRFKPAILTQSNCGTHRLVRDSRAVMWRPIGAS
jgi:hypothetical protein